LLDVFPEPLHAAPINAFGGKALGLITREQLATPKSAKGLLFEIHVGKGLPISVLHHKAAIQFLD